MKVKVGDKVKILAGKDKGKEGKVIQTLRKKDKVIVEGINMVKKHMKPNNANETGGILDVEAPIHVSNVKVIESGKNTEKKSNKKEELKAEVKKTEAKKTEEKKATTKKTATKKTTTKKSTKKEVGEK